MKTVKPYGLPQSLQDRSGRIVRDRKESGKIGRDLEGFKGSDGLEVCDFLRQISAKSADSVELLESAESAESVAGA